MIMIIHYDNTLLYLKRAMHISMQYATIGTKPTTKYLTEPKYHNTTKHHAYKH